MKKLTDPEITRELMGNYHKFFGNEFPEGLALAMERGEPWEDVPAVAFMLKSRKPTHEDLQWARGAIIEHKARCKAGVGYSDIRSNQLP